MIILTCGIYMITNKNTGQKYIGQSKDIEDRWYNHIHSPKEYSYIDRAIKKYGVSMFDFTVIESVSISMLLEREEYWIKKYNTYEDKNHYNLTPGGDFNPMCVSEIRERAIKNMPDKHGVNNPMYGKKHTEETKELIRKKAIGRKHTQESINKMKKTLSGRKKLKNIRRKSLKLKKVLKELIAVETNILCLRRKTTLSIMKFVNIKEKEQNKVLHLFILKMVKYKNKMLTLIS